MPTNKPTSVSIIVLTYKQTEVLNLIIQALNQQTYTGDMEVIVSDDGSPDQVAGKNIAVLNQLKCPAKYVWQPNLGYRASAARNNGIRVAQNDLLIFLDGDIVPFPELVEKHEEQHSIPNRLVAGNRTWIGEVPQVHNLEQLRLTSPEAAAIARGEKEHAVRLDWLNSDHPWRACFSANLSVRKESYVRFDQNFIDWGPDDAEFCYRMCVKHHLTPVYDESIGSYHLESPDAVGNAFRRKDHESIVNYIRNTFRFFNNCPGLKMEEVFYGFSRLHLERPTNTWTVIPRAEASDTSLREAVELARDWMQSNQPSSPTMIWPGSFLFLTLLSSSTHLLSMQTTSFILSFFSFFSLFHFFRWYYSKIVHNFVSFKDFVRIPETIPIKHSYHFCTILNYSCSL